MTEAGFRRASSSACAYARPRKDGTGFVTVGVQISSWGSDYSGNSFALNANGKAADTKSYYATVYRPLMLLRAEDCQVGIEIERRIRARFPLPAPEHEVWQWAKQPGEAGAIFRRTLDSLRVSDEKLWRPGLDIWLSYYGIADVIDWADFLSPRLIPLLDRIESESSSPVMSNTR